jgi:hypothetical protein
LKICITVWRGLTQKRIACGKRKKNKESFFNKRGRVNTDKMGKSERIEKNGKGFYIKRTHSAENIHGKR